MKRILIITGSLRKASFNHQLARRVEALLEGRAQVSHLDFGDVPFMNQDIEFPTPVAVARVREAVQRADGIWICSPEYNYHIPGVLKNLLDWLSRPLKANDWVTGSAVKDKPVTISGAAGKSGAAGVRKQLSALLTIMSMKVVGGVGTGVSLTSEAFSTDVLSLSPEQEAALAQQAEAFLAALN